MTEVLQSLQRDLRREFPQVIVFWHPIKACWQLYEVPKGSDWDGTRLRQVIVHGVPRWWMHPGAPRVFEDRLPSAPGEWLLEYLRQQDHWRRHGGARAFLKEVEERALRRKQERQARMHREHRGMADDIRRIVRDYLDGDPLAGRRKWQITKERVFSGEAERTDSGSAS